MLNGGDIGGDANATFYFSRGGTQGNEGQTAQQPEWYLENCLELLDMGR
jgi:hypothetical protein